MKKPGDFLGNHPIFAQYSRIFAIYTVGAAIGRPRLPLCKGGHGAAVTGGLYVSPRCSFAVLGLINNRPRKCLDYLSPVEFIRKSALHLA